MTTSLRRTAQVIVVGSVMFSFISYWRTAAVVLCDLGSTAYYIGGIVEQAIGPAAPWFILAVMLFSYAVRWVYIESCTLFIRGGVYRVVRAALGSLFAKIAVSALLFDYLLTGPISGVSAGKYLVGLAIESLAIISPTLHANIGFGDESLRSTVMNWGGVVIAIAITLYFYRQNLLGIHESSDKALKIMMATTVVAVIMLVWCAITLAVRWDSVRLPPTAPDLSKKYIADESGQLVPKINPITGHQEDPMGFLGETRVAERLRDPAQVNWWSVIGLIGILVAFGHSILAMSGEETLAQVYREVESPKLPNFKKAAFIVFVYSLLFTGGISLFAVLLIPDDVRMKLYSDNLLSGLAMNVEGPKLIKLILNALVVIVGFLILSGAVNTAIVGSNGVLNRVAEDGVMPQWFLKPHPRYGTTNRILLLLVGLQILIIIRSMGNTYLLGEAYAFGVVWSFVFQALSMVVLRFKDRRPREFKVPFNIRVRDVYFPIGLSLILLILLATAIANFFTKEVATMSGLGFGGAFFTLFMITDFYHKRRLRGMQHEHLEQFNKETAAEVTPAGLGLTKPYRKLVAIRSPQNLFMLEKALAETDPDTTAVVVMTAKLEPVGEPPPGPVDLDTYDQQLMTAVVQRAEQAGKQVKPLIVPTNNPLYAVIRTARDLQVQELVMGASNKYTAEEQLDQIALYWINVHEAEAGPLTVRILGRNRDVYFDLGGGNRIPKISERRARSVEELRAAGVGVNRVLLVHDGSPAGSDLFLTVMTMLDPEVHLGLVPLPHHNGVNAGGNHALKNDEERARQLDRDIEIHALTEEPGEGIVRLAREHPYELIVVPLPADQSVHAITDNTIRHILRHATCRVFLVAPPAIPQDVEQS
jgi:amino acid transporter/nucleotide-binding universal stress UspA family protein